MLEVAAKREMAMVFVYVTFRARKLFLWKKSSYKERKIERKKKVTVQLNTKRSIRSKVQKYVYTTSLT